MRHLLFPVQVLFTGLMLTGLWTAPLRGDDKSAEIDAIAADEQKLKNAYQDIDGKSLVKFLHTRARGEIEPKALDELIDRLDDELAAKRYQACQELVAIGAPVIPKLRAAAREDSRAAALAKRLLNVLEDRSAAVTRAAIRLLVVRRPDDMAEALLAYLPHSENEVVLEEIKEALAISSDKDKPEEALIAALKDPRPLVRATAVTVLCAHGRAQQRAELRKLLSDSSPTVRHCAAQALARANDPKAVSTLILLLADLPLQQGREAESFLTDLAGDQSPTVSLTADEQARQRVRDAWAKWWLDTEGPGLIKELEKRTLTEQDTNTALSLIKKLGDDSFEVRQKSEDELKKMGSRIIPLLKQALKDPDLEVRNRAEKCLAALEMDRTAPLSPVTVRLLALRKPKGAAAAILAYLPYAEDESLVDGLQDALNAVAYSSGKPDPALIKALNDKIPIRRAAAGAALAGRLPAEQMASIRKLLADEDNSVRLRVALALAMAQEPEAVPVLIRLVGEGSAEQAAAAEDYLYLLARDNPPETALLRANRQKDRATAWQRWWNDNRKTVTLAGRYEMALRPRYLGYVTLVHANNGQVVELGKDHKPRMTITGLQNPWDARWLRNNRILITEYSGRRVTERDTRGRILWEKRLPFNPIQAERLPNGHTFVVGQSQIVQYDRTGNEVLRIGRTTRGTFRTARRLPNGQIAVVTSSNYYIHMDRTGKELKSVRLPSVYSYQNEILDNGNVLVPLSYNNQIKEYNSDGKVVRTITIQRPVHTIPLPNKHLLVSSSLRPYTVSEVDNGKVIRSHAANMSVFRIRAR